MDPLRAAAPYLAYGFISLIGWTSRIRWKGLEHFREVSATGRGFIYAFWHQRQVILTYTHRGKGATVLVSRSRDGQIIAETMRLSRIGSVRGSSSRGASAAAKEMLEILGRGGPVGITPDGPKGPARTIKSGVLYLAQKSGCPILPITSAVSRRLELRSWDRFQVPLPFSRIAVVYGRPVPVGPKDDLEGRAAELKDKLDRITEEADRLVR